VQCEPKWYVTGLLCTLCPVVARINEFAASHTYVCTPRLDSRAQYPYIVLETTTSGPPPYDRKASRVPPSGSTEEHILRSLSVSVSSTSDLSTMQAST
jgi:hypothetical protein